MRTVRRKAGLWSLWIAPLVLWPLCVQGQVQAPTLGMVFDPSVATVRPVMGIAGAAHLGQPLDLGVSLATAAVSLRGDYVLGISTKGTMVLARNVSQTPSTESLNDLLDTSGDSKGNPRRRGLLKKTLSVKAKPGQTIHQVVLSPGGSRAALIDPEASIIHILAGLPDSPYVERTIQVPSAYGALTVATISDERGLLLAAFSDSTLAYVIEEYDIRPVAAFGRVSALAFLPGSEDALIADALYNEIHLVEDVSGTAGKRLLAGEREGISGPVAVAAAMDNTRVYVANAQSSQITIVGAGGSVPVDCPCRPWVLDRLQGNAVFALTPLSDGTLWVLDGDSAEASVFPVPPGDS